MSEREIQRIKCPKCGSEHDFEIWTRVNTDLDPVLKDKVRNGQLFRTVCPSCGQQIDVVYPCLYHEMENRIMIYYAPGEKAMQDALAAFDEGLDIAGKEKGFDPAGKGYRNRVVGSLYDLQEKIAIFEAGLDDRVIEICKVLIGSELRGGNAFASISLPGDIYKEVGNRYRTLIERYGDEKVIDMEWVMKSVNRAGNE